MKLYELEKNQRFCFIGVAEIFIFIRMDGMYGNVKRTAKGNKIILGTGYDEVEVQRYTPQKDKD